jgi:hypothetical protein
MKLQHQIFVNQLLYAKNKDLTADYNLHLMANLIANDLRHQNS